MIICLIKEVIWKRIESDSPQTIIHEMKVPWIIDYLCNRGFSIIKKPVTELRSALGIIISQCFP